MEIMFMESKQQIVPFDKRPNPNTGEKDIDPLLFRDCMNEMELLQPELAAMAKPVARAPWQTLLLTNWPPSVAESVRRKQPARI